jgi:hypothetical protein
MLLLNDGRTEASDIRSAWGLDEDEEAESASGDAEPVVEATDGGEEE